MSAVLKGFLILIGVGVGALFALGIVLAVIQLAFRLVVKIIVKLGLFPSIIAVGYYFITTQLFDGFVESKHKLWLGIFIGLIIYAALSLIVTAIDNITDFIQWIRVQTGRSLPPGTVLKVHEFQND